MGQGVRREKLKMIMEANERINSKGLIKEGDLKIPSGGDDFVGGASKNYLGSSEYELKGSSLTFKPTADTGKWPTIGYNLQINVDGKYYALFLQSGTNNDENEQVLGYRFNGFEEEVAVKMTKWLVEWVVKLIKSNLSDVQEAGKNTSGHGYEDKVTEEELGKALKLLDNMGNVTPKQV